MLNPEDYPPFWLHGPEIGKLSGAVQDFWSRLEDWLHEGLTQADISECSAEPLALYAWEQVVVRNFLEIPSARPICRKNPQTVRWQGAKMSQRKKDVLTPNTGNLLQHPRGAASGGTAGQGGYSRADAPP